MIGLCHLLSNDGRDVDHFFESAVQTYSDLRETPQLLRTVLLYFEVLKQGGMYKECIKVLTRGMVDVGVG